MAMQKDARVLVKDAKIRDTLDLSELIRRRTRVAERLRIQTEAKGMRLVIAMQQTSLSDYDRRIRRVMSTIVREETELIHQASLKTTARVQGLVGDAG